VCQALKLNIIFPPDNDLFIFAFVILTVISDKKMQMPWTLWKRLHQLLASLE